jgi:hypothetical protein
MAEDLFATTDNPWWWRRAELVVVEVARQRVSTGALPSRDLRPLRRRALDLVDQAGEVDAEVELVARLLAIDIACATGELEVAELELRAIEVPDWATPRIRLRWHLCRAAVALAREDPDVLVVVEEGVAALADAQSQVDVRWSTSGCRPPLPVDPSRSCIARWTWPMPRRHA